MEYAQGEVLVWMLLVVVVTAVAAIATVKSINRIRYVRHDDVQEMDSGDDASTQTEPSPPEPSTPPLWLRMRDEQLRNYRSAADSLDNFSRPIRGNPRPSTRQTSSRRGKSPDGWTQDDSPSFAASSMGNSSSHSSSHDSGSSHSCSSHHADTSSHSSFDSGNNDCGGGSFD